MAMKPNTKAVFEYLMAMDAKGQDVTAADVADALDLDKKVVNGIFTSAFQRKGYGERVEAEVELEDGTHSKIKLLRLNDEGKALNPDADAE